jgi:hypothetical protein
MARRGPRREPVQVRFAPDEIEELTNRAHAEGLTLSDYLRRFIRPPMPEHELMAMDIESLRQWWFENLRLYRARKEDPEPHGYATPESIWEPVMSARIENVLIAKGYAPALEQLKIEDRLRYEAGLPPKGFE